MQHHALALLLLSTAFAAPTANATPTLPRDGIVRIPAGRYVPLYRAQGKRQAVRVRAFAIDAYSVTRAQYLAFVRAQPAWRRSRVKPLFAEGGYLQDWAGDLDAGTGTTRELPVTQVSWFAAKAYCAWRGARLPTTDEWEYVAAASPTRRDATTDRAFTRQLVALYTQQRPPTERSGRSGYAGFRNVYGVVGLHGVTWEWVLDFNSILLSDDSRATTAHDLHVFCASGALGATNPENYAAFLRYGMRAGLTGRTTTGTLGFRCAQSV
jgi:formylglycine-generating enzyme required for sulfatase activity